MPVTLYVLRSRRGGKRYVGITNDLPRRLREHAARKTKAGHMVPDFCVVHTEEFADHATAREREKFLKSGQGRKWLDGIEAMSRPARGG